MPPKIKPVLDVKHFSFSSISTYLRCPKQFYFRYIEGRKEPPKIVLIEGSSHHEALEKNNLHKKEKGRDLKARQITESFMASLKSKVGVEEKLDWAGEDENRLYRRAVKWHEDYVRELAPRIEPELVEETFEKEVSVNGVEFILKGVVDLAYAKKCSDYKTISSFGFNNRKKEILSDLQLSFYSYATGYKEVENICFIKKDNPEIGVVEGQRSKQEIAWALRVASEVAKSVALGAFPMTDPKNWCCSELYCGYWGICRGKK